MSAEGAIGSFKIHYLSHWGHVLNEEENLKEYSLLLLLLFWLIHYTDIWVCVSSYVFFSSRFTLKDWNLKSALKLLTSNVIGNDSK